MNPKLVDSDVVIEIAGQRLRVGPAPDDAPAATPQRTESLARELVRGMLGTDAAPVIELVRGPGSPSRRELAAPGCAPTVIGRGDEATWVILDEDLSREHAEIRRDWSGVTIRDLESKNGTRVDGVAIDVETALHDGARLELGNVELVFRDPAERHLRGETPANPRRPATLSSPAVTGPTGRAIPIVAGGLAVLAICALIWILAA